MTSKPSQSYQGVVENSANVEESHRNRNAPKRRFRIFAICICISSEINNKYSAIFKCVSTCKCPQNWKKVCKKLRSGGETA
jgi:hypothetical protein